MNSKTAPTDPQASPPSSPSPIANVTVVDFRTREQWQAAFRAIALARKYTKTEILLAGSLAQNFYCKTGRCDPGYKKLAGQLNVEERTIKRAAKRLEADGWCSRKRGGRDEKVNFTLCIPSGIGDRVLSPMNDAPYVTNLASIGDTTLSPLNTEVVQSKSAAPPRAPRLVDSPVPVIIDPRAGAFRALCRTHPEDADPNTATEARKIFDQLIDEGLDPERLIEAAYTYCDICRGIDTVKPLSDWLRSRAFQPLY